MEAELFRADRRTDMTKLTVAFRNLAKAPKTCISSNLLLDRWRHGEWSDGGMCQRQGD
jgi:hypothetical protein